MTLIATVASSIAITAASRPRPAQRSSEKKYGRESRQTRATIEIRRDTWCLSCLPAGGLPNGRPCRGLLGSGPMWAILPVHPRPRAMVLATLRLYHKGGGATLTMRQAGGSDRAASVV